MKRLTARQNEVLQFICRFLRDNGFPPTVREIAAAFGISIRGSYDHIKALQKKGSIEAGHGRSRGIRVLRGGDPPTPAVRQVPMLGTVAAGQPLFAEENLDGTLAVPADMLSGGDQYFALRVRGDSMSGAGILNGDMAVIRAQPSAADGEIVVAMVDDAVTLKRLFVERNRVQLRAENPEFPPIYTQDVRILGKLACVLRTYS